MRLFALLFTFVLVAAACGDDDDGGDEGSSDTTEANDDSGDDGGDTTEAPEDGGEATGSLEGWKGTTPLPETTPEVEAFQDRMLEVDSGLTDFNYGPESYDAAIVIALAAQIAEDDGSAHAAEIVGVTTGGEKCTNYADCLAIVEAGGDVDYDGISGPLEFSGNGEPTIGSYGVLQFGADNRIDEDATTFKTIEAPPEVADIPLSETEVDRPGDGVLTFGTLLPETGNLAFLGPPEVAGVKVAVAEINEAGGFNGQDVVISESDSGDTTTDIASQSVERLLSENVDAIIGAASSGVTLTVIDAVVNAGVTMFSPANTSKELSDYDDKGLYFRNAPSDILQGSVLAEVIAEDGNSTIAIINLDDSYGNGLAEDLTTYFEEGGGEVLTTVQYAPDAQTFESEVNQIVGEDPDAIVVIGFEESARIVSELIKQGSGPNTVPIYGTDGNMGNATGEEFEAGG
ncbi:MAG TPA: ABC transporter substrate-binding protein [Iamia sp.]|nr:ABC transporter substrate-binding protein [Iamia sp.]